MPAKSKAQQALFGMALAVRKGELERSKVNSEVLDIVDSDMTNKEIEDFAKTKHKGLPEHKKTLKESILESLRQDNCKNLQFVVIKPEFLTKYHQILCTFEDAGYVIVKEKAKKLTLDEAKKLYKKHENESFYEDLCKYMTSALSYAMLMVPPEDDPKAYQETEKLKDEIREKFGKDDMKNVLHSSDSKENMEKESKVYF